MGYTNDFTGKKYMVDDLSSVYKNMEYSDIDYIELKNRIFYFYKAARQSVFSALFCKQLITYCHKYR